jgi:hypothetical protein
MTLLRTIGSYASPKKNARVLANPRTDICQAEWNLLANDAAQMTQTATKLWAHFNTALANGPVGCTGFGAQWGAGSANAPTITRTGSGIYTVSTPASWVTPGTYTFSLDPDGVIVTSEQVIFVDASGGPDGSATPACTVRVDRNGYTLTVYVLNGSNALSDLGGGAAIRIEAR